MSSNNQVSKATGNPKDELDEPKTKDTLHRINPSTNPQDQVETLEMQVECPTANGETATIHLPVHYHRSVFPKEIENPISILTKFKPMQDWVDSVTIALSEQKDEKNPFHSAPYELKSITIQHIDWKGKSHNPLFIKFSAEVTNGKVMGNGSPESLPGIVFMRGGSVGMLVVMIDEETGDEWVPLTIQPRIPVGTLSLIELPAGMLDGEGKFAGQAAKELKEECGIELNENDLIDLGESANGKGKGNLYPSAGGCDEFIRLFAYQKKMKKEEIEAMKGRMSETWKEGEKITLKVVRLKDLWRETQDFKALAAWALWRGLKDEGKI